MPKIDKVRYIAKINNARIIGISQTKLDKTILPNELEVNSYDLIRLDRSRRGGGVACFIKSLIAYSYQDSFYINTEDNFVDIYLPKFKPTYWVSYIDRPPDKSDFIKHINNVFTETGILDLVLKGL